MIKAVFHLAACLIGGGCILVGSSASPGPETTIAGSSVSPVTGCPDGCVELPRSGEADSRSRGVDQSLQNDSIRAALEYQRENYPASQYRDVYKNFMQDFFGPGHILASTAGAEAYLKREMGETEVFDGPAYESTGFRGNFYRVNIRLVKDGTIPYDVFFDAFVKSISGIVPPDGDYWMDIWNKVDNVISEMGWTFDNESADRESMAKQFKEENYIVHHSEAYNKAVNFHYRIISRDQFEQKILPYLRR